MSLADAITRKPFSNGTEGDAWLSCWCAYCKHDHGMHPGQGDLGCDLVVNSMMPEFPSAEWPWPEAWLPEPDDGEFALPSRLVCAMFQPCREGDCTGDPGAVERAERVSEVVTYWRSRPPTNASQAAGDP